MSDSRELAHAPQGSVPSESQKTLAMILEAARDPSVDAAKTESMVNLALKLQDRERESEFNRSKNAALKEMPVISKDGRIVINNKDGTFNRVQGHFAKWENLDRVVRPILAKHNLALSFEVDERSSGGILVRPILSHTNGFTERGGAMPIPADISGGKNAAQAIGSATSYGKRYTACAMLNIITEGVDDDGNMGATVSLPYERQAVVEKDARAAAEAGTYQDWFDKQPPRDRAWLIGSSLHAEFGGKALPAPSVPESRAVDQAESQRRSPPSMADRQPTQDTTAGSGEKKRQSPREWVDDFKRAVDSYTKVDELDQFADDQRDNLDKLKARNEALWSEANDAIRYRRDAIEEGRLV
jgi:hypothetical protein